MIELIGTGIAVAGATLLVAVDARSSRRRHARRSDEAERLVEAGDWAIR